MKKKDMNNFDEKLDYNPKEKNNNNLEDISKNLNNENISVKEKEDESLALQLRDFHQNQIEASLYAAGRPISIEEFSTKLEIPKKEVEELINKLAFDYLERSTALLIIKSGESYQMTLKPEYIERVSKFTKGGAIAEKYLRTLTIIALKQPILKSLVVKMRSSSAYEHIKYLLNAGLISAIKKGRTQELTTTDKYAEMFGLPKDQEQMKRVMISQLGLDEVSSKGKESSEDDTLPENEENTQE